MIRLLFYLLRTFVTLLINITYCLLTLFLIDDQKVKSTNEKLEGQPIYLRFLLGKPIGEKIPRNAPIMSYGEQALEPQYWFIIPSIEKADSLYFFFDQSCPKEKYGRYKTLFDNRLKYTIIVFFQN